jgi:hypothetical protein
MRMLMRTLYGALKLWCVAAMEEIVNDCALEERQTEAVNESMG